MTLALAIQLLASALTLAGSWLYGNKSPWGPWCGIAAQVPWWTIMITGGLWGLLPVNASMLVIHVRNLIKWRRDASITKWRSEGAEETLSVHSSSVDPDARHEYTDDYVPEGCRALHDARGLR